MRRPPSTCDYCLLLDDCILVLSRLTQAHSTDLALFLYIPLRSTPAALLIKSRTTRYPSSTPRCALSSSRPTWTFDDGDRASRSTLRSFAGDSSLTTHATPSLKISAATFLKTNSSLILRPPLAVILLVSNTFVRDGTPKGFVGMGQEPLAQPFQAWKTAF